MSKKYFWLWAFLFTPLFLLHPTPLSSQYTPKPYVSLMSQERPIGGVVEFTSVQDVKLQAMSYPTGGSAVLEIYQSTLDDLLQYLIHDDKYAQVYPKVDVSKFTQIQTLNLSLTDRSQDFSIPLPATGIFFAKLKMGDLTSQTYIIRSPFGTIAREAKDSLVLWSQDFNTKRSLVGGVATLYSLNGQKSIIGTANLDGDAIASLPLSTSGDVAVVSHNDTYSLVPLNARYLNGDYNWLTFRENTVARRYFIFTDRPIYQPGDTVNFKAITRDDDDGRYSLPQGSVKVEVSQGYDNKIYLLKDTLNINSNGYISSSFTIPKTAKTGDYQIRLNPSTTNSYQWGDYGTGDSLYFKVENYRKPEYFISAESPQINVVRGENVEVKVKGAYYSGQPLANITVNYKITATKNSYYDSDYYYESNGDNYYRSWYGTEVDSGQVVLNSKGQGVVKLPTNKNDSQGLSQVYFIEFTYQDDTGNPASSGVSVYVRAGEFSLYRDGNYSWDSRPNELISVPLKLISNSQGKSLSQKVNATLVRHYWQIVKNDNSKYPTYNPQVEEVGKYSFNTTSLGKTNFSFTPSQSGEYELKTVIIDSLGNSINKSFYFWVNDLYTNNYGYSSSSPTLKIVTDKKIYSPSDTATINILSEIPDRDVFVAFERGYQDRYQIVHLNGTQGSFKSQIYNHDLPNVFVTAKSFDPEYLAGSIQNLTIDTISKKVQYSLSTDKQNYAPGDEVTVNIKAVDTAGNPLETNLALWTVDKSIFALADKNYGDVFDQFWSARYNNTTEANSLEGILVIGGAEKGGCFLPGTKITMSDGTDKPIESVKVGDNILTRLSSNSSKLVTTSVTAIHSAKTADYYIINGTLKVTGNHLLYLNGKWSMAGFAQIGDSLIDVDGQSVTINSLERLLGQITVYNLTTDIYHTYFADGYYVHNQKGDAAPRDNFADTAYWNVSVNTNSQGTAQVKFKLPDNLTTWVIAALGASVETQVGEAFTEIKVNKDLVIRPALPNILGEKDTINVVALVNNFTDIESKSQVSLKTDAGQVSSPLNQNVVIPPQSFTEVQWTINVGQPKTANFEFSVKDNLNRIDIVRQKIDIRSTGYWQNSSMFKINNSTYDLFTPSLPFDPQKSTVKLSLSTSILGSLPTAMDYLINYPYGCMEQTTSSLLPKIIAKKYPAIFGNIQVNKRNNNTIDDGVAKLVANQNSDGGWSWWGGTSDSFVTSYVYRILMEAKSVGIVISDDTLSLAQKYFQNNYESNSLDNKVARSYGLSLSGDPKLFKTMTEGLDKLDNDHLAMIVYANIKAGISNSSQNGLDLLLSRATNSTAGVHWSAGSSTRFGSIEVTTALAIQAILISGNHQDVAANAINYLVKNRRYEYWASTFGTAQTIMAITDFSRVNNPSVTSLTYDILLDGQSIKSGQLQGIQNTPLDINISISKLKKDSQLSIKSSGNGELYTTLNQNWWIKDANSIGESHGARLTKSIVNHKGDQYNLVPGDLVDVTIQVSYDEFDNNSTAYAVIEDHLPAGLIPINTHLKNESQSDSYYSYQSYSTQYLTDGVIIPIYRRNQSESYIYQARVISSGSFNVPPANFSMMYTPEVWARSDSSTLVVDSTTKIDPLKNIQQSIPDISSKVLSPFRYVVVPSIFLLISAIIIYVHKKKNH